MNKYRAQKTMVNGITFASKHEATRYVELRYMEKAGMISDLQTQVPYELIPSQKRGGKVVERPVKYIADFVYKRDGETIVEDAKGGIRTKEYIIKRKLLLWEYGLQIVEV